MGRQLKDNKRIKSAPIMSLKIKGQNKKDVKNEGSSHLLIENKGAKKVLPLG